MLFPEQSFPPPSGAGFVQLRDRLCTPTPHDTLQDDHSSQELQPPSSNVGVNEHATELNDNPTQSCPPFNGDGLLHVRARILQPSPVGLEQGDHAFQFDHPPSTMQTLVALQFLDSIPLPGHGSPPFCGAGCVQFRVRICTPGPHVHYRCPKNSSGPSYHQLLEDGYSLSFPWMIHCSSFRHEKARDWCRIDT